MPGRPRKDVIREDEVGVYHVWTRCVRRARLCGYDPVTDKNRDYRKRWIYDRMEELSRIFAVDACVFAILSNHYHLIVRNRVDLVEQWSQEEVVRRWWMLYPERRDKDGAPAEPTPLEIRSLVQDAQRVEVLRKRLCSISWFMKSLNEWISKRCNREDNARGHFWEERFGARSLLSEGAILACAIYIDLNEIRAELAATPEESQNTSAYRRILARIKRRERKAAEGRSTMVSDYQQDDPDFWLCPIHEQDQAPLLGPAGVESVGRSLDCNRDDTNLGSVHKLWRHGFLPMTPDEYLELLDWTGRQIVPGKRGAIDSALAPILERLGLKPSNWLNVIDNFERWFHAAVGNASEVTEQAARTGRQWLHGVRACQSTFL